MDADGAPDPADAQEQLDEVRLGGEQLGELVDDDHEGGERRKAVGVAGLGSEQVVLHDVGEPPGVGEYLLATVDLAFEAGVHPIDQSGVGGEVGQESGDVRQLGEGREGRAALVVHEHERHLVGTVGDGQCEDQVAQQLALAGPGRPDAESMRPHPELRGLLEVQQQWCPGPGDAERDAEKVALGSGAPRSGAGRAELGRRCRAGR